MKYRILTADEYEKYKYIIPNPGRRFWLDNSNNPEKRFDFINEEGVLDRFGTFGNDTTVWLRPVIEYDPDEESETDFDEGDKVTLYGLPWTAVTENILVCDRCVEELKYDDSGRDFDRSYLKYAMYQYFKGRSAGNGQTALTVANEEDPEWERDEVAVSKIILPNLFFISAAVIVGIICALSFSPVSMTIFAIAEICMAILSCSFNVRQIKKMIRRKHKQPRLEEVKTEEIPKGKKGELCLKVPAACDPDLKEKIEKINGLFEAINSQGNSAQRAKIKFFYLPETKKTLEQYSILYKNGIDTPNSKECMELIRENLDKTIKLLTIEYDGAVSDKLLEVKLGGGVIGKMLDNAERVKMDLK